MRVSELGGYLNYVDTEEDYERYITVLPGTEKSAILEQLPETVTLIGEDGSALELTGEWNCLDYSKNTEGVYTFTFSKGVTGKTQDRYSLLKAYVTVAEEKEEESDTDPDTDTDGQEQPNDTQPGGCAASAGALGGAAVPLLLGGAAVLIRRKNPHRGKK